MKRNGTIDFWKFIFALIIVVFHAKNFALPGQAIFSAGSIAVDFFFVVSGFLMAKSSGKYVSNGISIMPVGPSTAKFIGNKIKGMIPNYWIAFFIALIVSLIPYHSNGVKTFKLCISSLYEFLFISHSGLIGFRPNAVTWYISAMLISMVIIFPILIKNRSLFLKIIAPILVVLIFSWGYTNWKVGLSSPSVWQYIAFKGLIRSFAEICLGCICFNINEMIKTNKINTFASFILMIVEFASYIFVIYYVYDNVFSDQSYFLVLLLSLGITISFSGISMSAKLFSFPIFTWLGTFSFNMFLAHAFWSHTMLYFFHGKTYENLMPIYLCLMLSTALIIHFLSKLIIHIWPKFISWFMNTMTYREVEHDEI